MNRPIADAWCAMTQRAPEDILDTAVLGDDGAHRAYRIAAADGAYILERARKSVIYDPDVELRNIDRLQAHISKDVSNRPIRVRFPEEARHRDAMGLWRLFREPAAGMRPAPEAMGDAIGTWHAVFHGFDATTLEPAYPDPLDAARLFDRLLAASARDPSGRLEEVVPELDRLMGLKGWVLALPKGRLRALCAASGLRAPALERSGAQTTALFDPAGVLPGALACDFGAACLCCAETDALAAFVDRFLMHTAPLLDEAERAALPMAPRAAALTRAARHLLDVLTGHSRAGQDSLAEARGMLALADTFERHGDQIEAVLRASLQRYL
ncbi:MAG: hypothetical protein E7317_11255 [Clostridiales bacterium]|nr:hypothetical protein [Clostridiales bacterium]